MIKAKPGPKPKNINLCHLNPIVDPRIAYLLGFLWADGYVFQTGKGTVRIGVEALTSDMIEIRPVFDLIGKWCIQERHRAGRKPQTTFSCSSRPFYEWLSANDYLKKSLITPIKVLTLIPQHLRSFWLRGFFDGDGNLYRLRNRVNAQVTLAGSFSQDWSAIESLISNIGCSFTVARVQKLKSKSSTLRLTGRNNTLKFLKYIYSGEPFGLSRKYHTYAQYDTNARGSWFNSKQDNHFSVH